MTAVEPGRRLQVEYNVYHFASIAASGRLIDQPVRILNPNADFFLTGISGQTDGTGQGAILLKDANGRAIANEPVWMENFASSFGYPAPLENEMLVYPPDSVILFDLLEVTGAGGCDFQIVFWGFKLYREGTRKC